MATSAEGSDDSTAGGPKRKSRRLGGAPPEEVKELPKRPARKPLSKKKKRPDEDHVQVPPRPLTREAYFNTPVKSDRTLLCWALQTETDVRLAKVIARGRGDDQVEQAGRHQQRGGGGEDVAAASRAAAPTGSAPADAPATSGPGTHSTTLDSDYLLQVYPDTELSLKPAAQKPTNSRSNSEDRFHRDLCAFRRKAQEQLSVIRNPDHGFSESVGGKLAIEGYTETEGHLRDSQVERTFRKGVVKAVPPNLLYFRMILDAFLGFEVTYNMDNPAIPRAAIMGGAVVAVLSAFRDQNITEMFEESNLEEFLDAPALPKHVDRYEARKTELMEKLSEYFLDDTSPKSAFSASDADIFLQASPLTRSLVALLTEHGLEGDVMDHIGSYLGGCGMVHEDLHRYASHLFRADGGPQKKYEEIGSFVFALAKNGLSAMLGRAAYEDAGKGSEWPRSLQLIMLNEKADLLGALMDFDISVASCAYDGLHVYVTPRAAFSLMTLTQIVTPFILQENRNRKRIAKVCS